MTLKGKKIAVLAENQYEDLELWYPVLRLREAGAEVVITGVTAGEVYQSKHGYPAKADAGAGEVDAGQFAAVVIPGGYAPDYMRRHKTMLDLVKKIDQQGGVVAFICHAGWVPISAGIVKGRRVTSVGAIKDDLINAGASWVNEEVVVDGRMVSSRGPDDLPAFCREIIKLLGESR